MHRDRERFGFLRCRRCDLIYLSPRVAPAALARYYDETYLPHRGEAAWGRYARFAAEGQRRTDVARVRRARLAAGLGPGSAVLDVGCGRPTFLEALCRATGARGTGIDPSDAGWAGEPGRWAAAGLRLRRGTIADAAPGAPYDLITLWHTLEHDYTPLETLRYLLRFARPGGGLIVEVPNFDSLTRRLHGGDWAGLHTPRHTAIYTPATLAAMLRRAGWVVERQDTHGTLDPYVLYWLGRQERAGRALDGSLERAFPGFMLGKLLTLPVALAQRWMSLGVQLAVARAPHAAAPG
ncbi:MAG TPA: class I SAM-dependent methyltransferase [Gemmatimonadales bacterium]|nr:class I SAM-dependent methyltransferase [Gemmatimonadales bacterium]